MKHIALILVLATLPALAQQPAPKPEPKATEPAKPTAPVVSDKLLTRFFKAKSETMEAQAAVDQSPQGQALKQKQAEFQKVVEELQKTCGANFVAGMGPQGDPFCLPRPETPKAEPKVEPKK